MEEQTGLAVSVLAVFADPAHSQVTASLIADDEDVTLVGRATDTDEAIAQARELLPDVVLLELPNPAVDPRQLLTRLRQELPVVRILPVADRLDADTYDLLLLGATGGVDRSEHPKAITSLLVGAARREAALPHAWAQQAMEDVASVNSRDPFADVLRLTETERELLERLAGGASVDEVADEYKVTYRLVALHIGYIVAKLQRHAHLVDTSAQESSGTTSTF